MHVHRDDSKLCQRLQLFCASLVLCCTDSLLQETPIDIAANYHRIDIPIDIAGGIRDMIIPSDAVYQHVQHMQAAGKAVTFKEFDFGHLDFTMSSKEDLTHHVLKCAETWEKREARLKAQQMRHTEAEKRKTEQATAEQPAADRAEAQQTKSGQSEAEQGGTAQGEALNNDLA